MRTGPASNRLRPHARRGRARPPDWRRARAPAHSNSGARARVVSGLPVDTVTGMPDVNDFNRTMIDEFRQNGGKVSGVFENAPLLLITTTGAKSGKKRTNPVVYTSDGERLVVIASKGGAPSSPDWYHNLVANPAVTVELPDETFTARATVAEGEERDRLFAAQASMMPAFAEYEQKTERQIPVVLLERI